MISTPNTALKVATGPGLAMKGSTFDQGANAFLPAAGSPLAAVEEGSLVYFTGSSARWGKSDLAEADDAATRRGRSDSSPDGGAPAALNFFFFFLAGGEHFLPLLSFSCHSSPTLGEKSPVTDLADSAAPRQSPERAGRREELVAGGSTGAGHLRHSCWYRVVLTIPLSPCTALLLIPLLL